MLLDGGYATVVDTRSGGEAARKMDINLRKWHSRITWVHGGIACICAKLRGVFLHIHMGFRCVSCQDGLPTNN